MKGPRWPLERVRSLAARNQIRLTQAGAVAHFHSRAEAFSVARGLIAGLSPRDFSRTVTLRSGAQADVYGVSLGSAGWYLKPTIVEPDLVIVSLHPAARPIRTRRGRVVPWRRS